ncbi:MAG: 1-deoxy-D-xylulose-5-phosphate synthase [Planctomycetota bacterium]|nr:MAG: 1-deoxy-D-xylulose-5-phosphate synthase [Planctomycetota bacterium]
MTDKLLEQINWPADLKHLSREQLPQVASEMREYLMDVVSKTGGHLGSGMGAVELTLALHYVFNFKDDRLVFDVSHQCYPHKILTGRRNQLPTLRQKGGLSGFTNRFESPYDVYTMGHAGTATSAALGIAHGDALIGRKRQTVAVVGDASLGAGVAFEALNHGGELGTKLLVILNDNHWSIARTVGALSDYLSSLRSGSLYYQARRTVHQLLQAMPVIGEKLDASLEQGLRMLHSTLQPGQIFEAFGLTYHGPIDGHDTDELIDALQHCQKKDGVVLLHVKTQKGRGIPGAEDKADKGHAAKPAAKAICVAPGEKAPKVEPKDPSAKAWTTWFADALIAAGERDESVVALTAAMPAGTGVDKFMARFPKRGIDGGIAEQHTVAFASGLASSGLKPVAAIYSTFLQRGYDQVFQEVALQKLPVFFAMDRAGVVGEDGATHHGIFDIAYLGTMPEVSMLSPRDGNELQMMLDWGLDWREGPVAMRFARGSVGAGEARDQRPPIELGKGEVVQQGRDLALVAYGSQFEHAQAATQRLENLGLSVELVNMRFAKPIDMELIQDLRARHELVLTVEDHSLRGGFGSCFLEALHMLPPGRLPRVRCLGVPDEFQEHATREELLAMLGLDAAGIAKSAIEEFELLRHSVGRFSRPSDEEPPLSEAEAS